MKPVFEKINKQEDHSFFIEEINRPYFTDQWHFHPEIEILYVIEGFGTRYVGDSIESFFPGDIVLVGANTPHVWASNQEYMNPENNLVTKGICIQIQEEFIYRIISIIPEFKFLRSYLQKSKRGIQFPKSGNQKLRRLMEKIATEGEVGRVISLFKIFENMVFFKNSKTLSSPSFRLDNLNSADKNRMEIIYRHVIENYRNKIFIEEVASSIHLTPHSFCRYFKSRTNKSFSTFVNEVRIGNACMMLIDGDLSVSQICYETGFNYLSNFNRQFKKIKGLTPSEFQKNYKTYKFSDADYW